MLCKKLKINKKEYSLQSGNENAFGRIHMRSQHNQWEQDLPPSDKPPLTLAQLIAEALTWAKDSRLRHSGICWHISRKYLAYKIEEKGLKDKIKEHLNHKEVEIMRNSPK